MKTCFEALALSFIIKASSEALSSSHHTNDNGRFLMKIFDERMFRLLYLCIFGS